MNPYQDLAKSIEIRFVNNKPVATYPENLLTLIGVGRSAFVFKIKETNKALKLFFPGLGHFALEEAKVYKAVQGIHYFPALYDSAPDYLVIDYIEGHTFFECLTLGIPISGEQIQTVDLALSAARKRGLNPSDIHLKNLMITPDGKIKLIDVARFRQTKTCHQWEDLKNAYDRFYTKPFFPKKIPAILLNLISRIYKSVPRNQTFQLEAKSVPAKNHDS